MPTPVSYLSGNTLSYQSGMVKKGTVGLNLTSSLTGNYRWWNGIEVTASQYLIYSDTYSTGASNEANVTPAAWSTPDLTDQSLLNLINTLPDRIGQTAFTTLSNALIWLNESGKYFVVKNSYENIVTSGLTLNLDAAWTNSYATGTTTWNDLSGSGNTFTLLNGVAFNSSDYGSLTFDGTDDYTKTTASFMNGATQGTFEFWFQTSSVSGGGSYYFHRNCLIGKASGPDNGLGFNTTSNRLRFRLGADSNLDSTIELSTNIIYHVVGTWDSGGSKLYINGVLNNSNNTANLSWYTSSLETIIGRVYVGSAGASFTGKIYSARAYNRALSQSEILQNYHVTKQRFGFNNIVGTNLVLNLNSQNNISYPTSGTSWYDLTGNNNTGVLTNGPTFDSTTRSVVFDGVDDYVVTSSNIGISGATPRTLECWYYVDSTNTKSILGYGGQNNGLLFDTIVYYVNGYLTVIGHYYGGGYDTISTLPSRNTININQWNHVVHMYDGTTASLYTNGVLSNTKEFSISAGNQLNTNNSTFKIGTGQYTGAYQYATGKISVARIYNKILSQSEILQNYYQGNIVTNGLIMNLDAGNLVSYGGTGTSWKDLTNTTTGGTLTNGPTYSTLNGGSIVFDGIDDTVSFPAITLGSTFTISQTLVASGTYNYGYMPIGGGSINGGSTYRGYVWFNTNSSFITTEIIFSQDGEVGGFNFTLPASIPRYTLFQYTLVKNGSTAYFYINGNLITTQSVSAGTNFTVRNLGWSYSSYYMNRDLYNTLIYNRALTESEVIQNFNAHKSRYGL